MSEGAGQRASGGGGFDPKTLEGPAKALVAGEWQDAVAGLVTAAATAASGNPFAGIVAGGAAKWLWAKVAARTATAKLKAAAQGELAALDEAQQWAEMKACVIEALQEVKEQDATEVDLAETRALAAELGEQTELRPHDLQSIADTLEEGLGEVLRAIVQGRAEAEAAHAESMAEHRKTQAMLRGVASRDSAGLLAAYRASLRHAYRQLPGLFSDQIVEAVFVELSLDEEQSARAPNTAGGHTRFAGPEAELQRRLLTKQLRLRDLLQLPGSDGKGGARWVVLGDPGGGKSTLARHLVWDLAGAPAGPLPVYAPLPALAAARCHPFDFAETELKGSAGANASKGLAPLLFQRANGSEPTWLLLDGLDEVAPEHRAWVDTQLGQWAQSLSSVPIVVFSRPIAYEQPGLGFKRQARILPLDKDKQAELLERWLGESERAQALLRQVYGNPGLRDACRAPLNLSLLAFLDKSARAGKGASPRNKLELFDRSLEVLLERGHSDDRRGVANPSYAREILARLSSVLQRSEGESWTLSMLETTLLELEDSDNAVRQRLRRWDDATAFLKDVAIGSAVLAPHLGDGAPWGFLHRQFRELLAAQALRADNAGDVGVLAKAKALHPQEVPRWAEVLGFACELAPDPFELFKALADINQDLGLRVLPELQRVDCVQAMEHLLGGKDGKGWDGDYLVALLDRWMEQGNLKPDAASAWLWRQVEPERSTEELAYFHYALEHLVKEVDRQRFFDACGRPLPTRGLPLPDLVPIRAGTYPMGSPEDEPERYDDEGPQHEVTVSAFELSATAVTNAQYEAFDPNHERHLFGGSLTAEEAADHPVVNVSFWQAYLYCRWAGGQLATEAQWEYACGAGTTTPFSFGDNITTDQVNYHGDYPYADGAKGEYRGKTVAVGSLPANPFALHEMHGNVLEWCADWYGNYSSEAQTDPWGPEAGEERVLRGGSWLSFGRNVRIACRYANEPGRRLDSLGFRLSRGQNEPGPKTAEPSEASERRSPGRRRGGTSRSSYGNA